MRKRRLGRLAGISLVLVVGMVAAACSSTPKTTTTTASPATTSASSGPSNITPSSFTNSLTVMSEFKGLAAAGKGKIAAILPDTVSSTRYVEFDAPRHHQGTAAVGALVV